MGQMNVRYMGGGVRYVCFFVFLLLLISPIMSCSKSNPVTPGGDAAVEMNEIRKMLWVTGDHTIADQASREKRVDVTNVVLGREYVDISGWPTVTNGTRGYILTHDHEIPTAQDPVELVVVAWTEESSMAYDGGTYDYWDVHFKVLAYDDGGSLTESQVYHVDNLTWDPGEGSIPGIQNYPCVTAHIGDEDEDDFTLGDPKLIVDIAFQRGTQYGDVDNWTVCHQRFVQDPNSGLYDDMDPTDDPYRIASADPWSYYAIHPDIVYGTYFRIDPGPFVYDIDKVMIAFEMIEKSSGDSAIVLAECNSYEIEYNGWSLANACGDSWDNENANSQYPRIDAGIDCSDPRFESPQFYVAAVVWHVASYDSPIWTSDLYYNYKPFNVYPAVSIEDFTPVQFDSFDSSDVPSGLPYIDIDPIENVLESPYPETYSHMVWSRFRTTNGRDVEPWYTNSELVMQNFPDFEYAIRQVYNTGYLYREGLATIATYSDQEDSDPYDQVGTIQFISAYYYHTEYPVYSVDFWYDNEDPEDPDFSGSKEAVSDSGYSSIDEFPWECGPNSAMRGGDITFCAWTMKDGSTYDIISDQDI